MPTGADANAELPTLLVTGGAGFIGSAGVRLPMAAWEYRVVTLHALTYSPVSYTPRTLPTNREVVAIGQGLDAKKRKVRRTM